jgi:hypothetical protein
MILKDKLLHHDDDTHTHVYTPPAPEPAPEPDGDAPLPRIRAAIVALSDLERAMKASVATDADDPKGVWGPAVQAWAASLAQIIGQD